MLLVCLLAMLIYIVLLNIESLSEDLLIYFHLISLLWEQGPRKYDDLQSTLFVQSHAF